MCLIVDCRTRRRISLSAASVSDRRTTFSVSRGDMRALRTLNSAEVVNTSGRGKGLMTIFSRRSSLNM